MLQRFAIIAGLTAVLLSSCSNDLDINAQWKETTVVFGLMSKQDSVHYLRLSKAFLGEGDAMKFASIADSVYYDPQVIEVKIEEYLNNSITRTFELQAATDIPKDPGIFAWPGQVVYTFQTPANEGLNPMTKYQLTVHNKKSNHVLKAETQVLGNMNFDMPLGTMNFYPQHSLNVKWKSVEGGALYEVFVSFLYREYHLNKPSDTVRKFVELNLGRLNMEFKGAFQSLNKTMTNLDMYRTIGLELAPPDPNDPVSRIADSLLVRINVADEDLMTYLLVNQPSNTLAQERPQFTNVENGVGIFASRGSYTKKFRIGDYTVDSLRSNQFTRHLNFEERP